MPDLNVSFTDAECDALRARATAEGTGVESFAHDAVTAAVDEHARLFDEAAAHVLAASAELNRRLA